MFSENKNFYVVKASGTFEHFDMAKLRDSFFLPLQTKTGHYGAGAERLSIRALGG